ncbi:MAG TPA: hypothetical protein VE263_00955 [Candidatus Angelobacter sp.]|nr:hypothetical protein [Candidatus Angelobacter sp.]
MLRRNLPRKPNGHAGPNGRPNGHGPDSVERGGVQTSVCPDSRADQAASDDASRTPVALAAPSGATNLQTQADTDCEAYAAAAPPPTQSASRGSAGEEKPRPSTGEPSGEVADDPADIPGGALPLPSNVTEFVEEIHRRVDLFEVWQGFLRSKDDKLRQRAVEKLTEMRYKGAAALADEPQQIIIDMPGPNRD